MARKKIAQYLNPWMFARAKKRKRVDEARKRDGDLCWRCEQPMNFTEPRNKRRSATIDHYLPKSKGGTLAIENVRLCHSGCNRHMADNLPEQKDRMRLRGVGS